MGREKGGIAIARAGWLFADLMLVIAIVFLSSQPPVPVLPKVVHQAVLNKTPLVFQVPLNISGVMSGSSQSLDELHSKLDISELGKASRDGLVAGVVLTFSGGSCGVNAGIRTSNAINAHLSQWYPSLINANTATKAYWGASCSQSELDVYLFVK